MDTQNFTKLIQSVTGRDFQIATNSEELNPETEYKVYKILPITDNMISFYWKTPKTEEKFLKSFITAFCNKYKEPNPKCYDGKYANDKNYCWANFSDKQREYAYGHHSSNMLSKKELLEQVQANFNNSEISAVLCKYGFYTTEYGIGIFAFWETEYVVDAILKFHAHLKSLGIPFKNEYSDARWVFRFKLGLDKISHFKILSEFNQVA
jgi:hypothetical protein